MVRLVGFFGLLLGVASCVKSTDSVSPGQVSLSREGGLFVLSFIAPQDSILTAKVAELVAVTSPTTPPPIRNARVTISDGTHLIVFSYDEKQDYYYARPSAPFAVRAGGTYRLTVALPDGRQVDAQTTVPTNVPLTAARVDSTITGYNGQRTIRYSATLSWTSAPGLSFYRGWGLFEQTITPASGLPDPRNSQPDFGVLRGNNAQPEAYTNTGTFTLPVPPGSQVRTRRVRLGLLHTDENYFRYQTALEEQQRTPNSLFVNGPVLFTNIQGGYGVFAAYNASYLTL